uniref:Ig-like domain-containing protein n=1 Tax=Terrapene triunguis TaxID=2587831 RepID=A0A674JM47_9SAUR
RHSLSRPQRAQFTVTGPNHPVIASLGGEAVLYCRLSPRMSAENMEVRWFRSKYSEVVHLYRGGRDQYGEQMLKYQGRTELLKDDITNGRVSLRIRNIRPSDDGQYKCFFQSSVSYEEALLELQVGNKWSLRVHCEMTVDFSHYSGAVALLWLRFVLLHSLTAAFFLRALKSTLILRLS